MTDSICGSTDTQDGTKCQRTAGWGTDREIGPCKDHETDHRQLRKLTDEVRSAIMGAKRAGAFDKHAAQLAGITPNTLANWKRWAQEDLEAGVENDLTEFYLDYQRAHAAGAVETLRECRPEFVAERAHGYTKTERHELSGPGGTPIQTEDVTDEERAILLDAFDAEPET